jgi:hypothetical protein
VNMSIKKSGFTVQSGRDGVTGGFAGLAIFPGTNRWASPSGEIHPSSVDLLKI